MGSSSEGPSQGGSGQAPEPGGAPGPALDPQFITALKKLVRRAASDQAPDGLLARIFTGLKEETDDPCLSGPVTAWAAREKGLAPWQAEVRAQLGLLRSVTAVASLADDPKALHGLAALAEEEHEKLEKGGYATGQAPAPAPPQGFAGWPAFQSGRIRPGKSGRFEIGGVRGVFVEYISCQERCASNTLLAFDTREDPEAHVVKFQNSKYWATRHAQHALIAWRGAKDGWLYILVTHCPLKNTLALANLLRG
jgi:hypothetical protein